MLCECVYIPEEICVFYFDKASQRKRSGMWYIIFSMTVHLALRSCYTLLDSTVRIPSLIEKAKQYGYRSIALTDHNVMFGAAPFIRACNEAGIHGIVGMEADCLYHERKIPFLLLSQNNTGYRNLIRLCSLINEQENCCTAEQLCTYSAGNFLIAYGEGGWLESDMLNDNIDGIKEKLAVMKKELPAFDIALSYQDAALWRSKNEILKRLCGMMKIRTVALNKICYLDPQDAEAYRIVTGIRTQRTVRDQTLIRTEGRYFLSEDEMRKLYAPDDLARTDEIAAACRADYKLPLTDLPVFRFKGNGTSAQYLRQLCMTGLRKRLNGQMNPVYEKRLSYELSVITRMHFENYFLIVYDFIRYARKQGIYVGPGRGSAAGSLTAYCLGITQVDPVRYNLLFERFLNPERISMPDIDTDIPDSRRQDVIRYVYDTYGADHVADIVTFGTLGARQVIRDVAKVMNVPQKDSDLLLRQIPNVSKITLRSAYEQNPRLREIVSSSESISSLFRMAQILEGLPRHTSTHAAGIIMSRLPLNDVVPTMRNGDGLRTSQFTMEYLEERGLIKMDFLGLRNLTIIDAISTEIKKEKPDFRIMDIPYDDPQLYRVFSQADTAGIFQFESEGMKTLLRQMKPQCFDDIAAALALYRPASKDSIPLYLSGRADPSSIIYPHPELEPVLRETYGVMIYQEQAMLAAQKAAGFSLGKADVLRKAISKKGTDQMEALKADFLKGCAAHGYPQKTAEDLWAVIDKFGGYGFNKSHAVAYAVVACQLAYLKAFWPMYFYPALLDSVTGDEVHTVLYINECRKRGIRILYPDVNSSTSSYSRSGNDIMLPLAAIKGIGAHAADTVISERKLNGPYKDFFDFTARVLLAKISRKMIELMIDAGALDTFRVSRRTMKASLDDAVRYGELVQIPDGNQMKIDLGLVSKPNMILMKEDPEEKAENEKNALGFCLGEQPVTVLRRKHGISLPQLAVISAMQGPVSGFAMIQNVKVHRTRMGDMMAFVKLTDETGELEITVMPKLYAKCSSFLVRGNYVVFDGKITDRNRSMLADHLRQIQK